jgi:hypothetical protein
MQPAGDKALLEMRAEIFRLVRLCAPNLASLGTITFEGEASNERQRRHWVESVFVPVLAPAIQTAWWAGKSGFREMAAADAAIDTKLVGPLAKTSRAAGRQIAACLHAPIGEVGLERFLSAILRGETPGHMATVFAARASVFHFPRDVMLAGLAFTEMRTARVGDLWTIIEDCLQDVPVCEPSIFRAA